MLFGWKCIAVCVNTILKMPFKSEQIFIRAYKLTESMFLSPSQYLRFTRKGNGKEKVCFVGVAVGDMIIYKYSLIPQGVYEDSKAGRQMDRETNKLADRQTGGEYANAEIPYMNKV